MKKLGDKWFINTNSMVSTNSKSTKPTPIDDKYKIQLDKAKVATFKSPYKTKKVQPPASTQHKKSSKKLNYFSFREHSPSLCSSQIKDYYDENLP